MTYDYSATAAVANRLIARYGQSMTLTRKSLSGSSPTSKTSGTASTATSTVSAVVLPMEAAQIGQDIGGTAIRSTDAMIYIAPNAGTAPQNGDTLTDGTDTWAILRANVLRPGGSVVLYDCVGRK